MFLSGGGETGKVSPPTSSFRDRRGAWGSPALGVGAPRAVPVSGRSGGSCDQAPLVSAVDQRALVAQQFGLGVEHPLADLDAARPLLELAPVADGALSGAVALGYLGGGQVS